jgi:hypothetical protein
MNQIQERFTRAERCIEMACSAGGAMPEKLRSTLSDLDRQVHDAEPLIQRAQQEGEVRECIDRLEALGDRAMAACRDAGNVDPQLRDALQQAHDELSQLKQQLH